MTFHVVCFVQFSKNYLIAHLRLPYVNIFIFQCQLSFSISFFVVFCVSASATVINISCSIYRVNTFYKKISHPVKNLKIAVKIIIAPIHSSWLPSYPFHILSIYTRVKILNFMLYYYYRSVVRMSIKYSNKINKIRTFALSLVFISLFIAYLGVFFRENIIIMTTFMMVGFLAVIASTVVYFWIGMLSTKTIPIICPSCDKPTKMLGPCRCMYALQSTFNTRSRSRRKRI